MSDLTKEQREFLTDQNVCLSLVFDAEGMCKTEYREVMKSLDKHIAYNTTPCKKAGHTMRTRAGHCIQCNTARIAFQKRHSEQAFVYVAGSLSRSVIKVGITNNIENRMESLNQLQYASASDWTCIHWIETKRAGEVEFSAHDTLKQFAAPTTYTRFGRTVNCLETFYCPAQKAIDAVRSHASDILNEWSSDSLIEAYDFNEKTGNEFKRFMHKDEQKEKEASSLKRETKPIAPLTDVRSKPKEKEEVLDKENSIKEERTSSSKSIDWHDLITNIYIAIAFIWVIYTIF